MKGDVAYAEQEIAWSREDEAKYNISVDIRMIIERELGHDIEPEPWKAVCDAIADYVLVDRRCRR
jgi:hypothetical protein